MLSSKPAGPAQGEKLAKANPKKRGTIDDIDFLVEEELSRKSEQEDPEMKSTPAMKVEISSKPNTDVRRQSTPASSTLPMVSLGNHRSSMEENITGSGESKMFKELFTTANKSKGIAGIAFEPETHEEGPKDIQEEKQLNK
jgi:hypothetical protein